MVHLRIVSPPDLTERVMDLLTANPSVINIIELGDVARRPDGDVILCDTRARTPASCSTTSRRSTSTIAARSLSSRSTRRSRTPPTRRSGTRPARRPTPSSGRRSSNTRARTSSSRASSCSSWSWPR